MKSMQDAYALRKAGGYDRPRQASQALPLVYGNLSAGAGGGVWPAACLDTEAFIYAYCGAPVLSAQDGNQVRVFDKNGAELSGFVFNHSHDLEGRGAIATLTFGQDMRAYEPLSLAGCGRADESGLLLNPLEVARDFLLNFCGLEATRLDNAAWARASSQCKVLGYHAAGLVSKDQAVSQIMSELLSCFLGSWWMDARGRLRVSLQHGPGLLGESELTAIFGWADNTDAVLQADLDNICNRLICNHTYNWMSREYQGYEDGQTEAVLRSRSLYGDQVRSLDLPWVREAATVRAIQRSLVSAFAYPVRMLTLSQDSFVSLHAERGDYVCLSCAWLKDSLRRPLVNQIMRVLSVEPDLDKRQVRFTLLDTGFYKTTACVADGSETAEGVNLAGGQRDIREAIL